MPPATAPTPAPTAAPTGPPTTAPVTAPVVAPAAAPSCACETTGSDSASAIVAPVSNFNFIYSSTCACVCARMRAEGERPSAIAVPAAEAVSCKEPSSRSTISPASNSKRWEDLMEQVMRPVGVAEEVVIDEIVEPSVAGISWAAVLAGAIASCALTLVLLSLGAGLGFSVVSPWSDSGVSATTFEIGTGLYFIVMAMISSAIGGYLAGRLRNRWIGGAATAVVFRGDLHGFLAWALASVLGALLLASPASSLIGGTLSGATQVAANSAQSSQMDGYVDTLLRSDTTSAQGQQNP